MTPLIAESVKPKTTTASSFNIKIGNRELWTAPNGTKPILESLTSSNKHIGTFTTSINSQIALTEFELALKTALKQNGIVTDKMPHGGNWEFLLSALRNIGENIVVKHARYNPK
ncbi:hypothetical protein A9G41_11865 [Gilliamella sp. Nev5-1]|uniref:hypothetical protein n=1 Tax=Gilliamella sp. Nev5-1 TaxID=3120251 RepID=UPI000827AC04|nr:hypothetical protein [Gilliamella apicola]OCG66910.1 hypothetical protein A9G41_11865 [Gilliamella apicola]